jgi:hypothetical protein
MQRLLLLFFGRRGLHSPTTTPVPIGKPRRRRRRRRSLSPPIRRWTQPIIYSATPLLLPLSLLLLSLSLSPPPLLLLFTHALEVRPAIWTHTQTFPRKREKRFRKTKKKSFLCFFFSADGQTEAKYTNEIRFFFPTKVPPTEEFLHEV